jgi:superfamily II DNA or RNA helicase
VDYNFVLGLTATMKRLDAKDHILNDYAPICTKLTMAQARAKGWVSNYREYWIGLELQGADKRYYEDLQEKQLKFFRVFGMDFDAVKRGLVDEQYRRNIARELDLDGDYVYIAAVNTMRYLRITRQWLIGHGAKVDAAYELITALDRKTLTFGESINVAETLSERIGSKAMAYHSQMIPIEKETFRDKEFKTEAGALRNAAKTGNEYKLKHRKHVVQQRVVKKIGGKKLKEYVLHKIANTAQLQTVTTAKSLNEGFDFPGAELGVTLSRSSSPTTYTQQTGRVVRLSDGQTPVMVHIYLKDTKDENWLKKAGWQSVGCIKVDSVQECLDHIKLREAL